MSEASATACAQCGGRGFVITGEGHGVARRCVCRQHRGLDHSLDEAQVPSRYRRCRLDNFQTAGKGTSGSQLLRARSEAQRYTETFLAGDGVFRDTGLIFIGPPGTGKTHLAVAVLIELIEKLRVRGRFVDFTELIDEIQASFDPSSEQTKHDLIRPLVRAELLVLDELGARKPSPWASDVLYLVINGRYAARRPTLFTTNFPLDVKEPETLDRGASSPRDLTPLSRRIRANLLSRLYEVAKPIHFDTVRDYRPSLSPASTLGGPRPS